MTISELIKIQEQIMKSMAINNHFKQYLIFKIHRNAPSLEGNRVINLIQYMLDIIMPVMDGGETYDKLKKINPDIKVLLSSGYGINGQATEILNRGCNGFIQKPFDMKTLSKKIREILDEGNE